MVRRVLWVLLCLIAGGPCAFLALEGIGAPLLEIVVALVAVSLLVIGTRHHVLAETLIAFGLTYSIEIARFAVPDLVFAAEQNDIPAAAYSAGHLAVAGVIVLSGLWILLTRRGVTSGPAATSRAAR